MDIRRLVGQNVRRIRLERGLSQEALAYDAEVNRAHMSALERGVANPTVVLLDRLARVLKCAVGDLTSAPTPGHKVPHNLPRGKHVTKKRSQKRL